MNARGLMEVLFRRVPGQTANHGKTATSGVLAQIPKRKPSPHSPNKASHLSYRARCFHYCFVCQPLFIAAYSSAHLCFNPLNAELNPICHLLPLLGAHHIFHVSRIRVKHVSLHSGLHKTRAPRRRGYHMLRSGPDRL